MGDATTNIGAWHESLNIAAALEAAGRLPDRQQPVRDGHQRREGLGRAGAVQEGLRLQHARRAGGRQRPAGRARRHPAALSSWPARRSCRRVLETVSFRHARPLGGRSGPLPPPRVRGAGPLAGPDPGLRAGAAGGRADRRERPASRSTPRSTSWSRSRSRSPTNRPSRRRRTCTCSTMRPRCRTSTGRLPGDHTGPRRRSEGDR